MDLIAVKMMQTEQHFNYQSKEVEGLVISKIDHDSKQIPKEYKENLNPNKQDMKPTGILRPDKGEGKYKIKKWEDNSKDLKEN